MLDPHQLLRDCIADAPPPCARACPLGIDVKDMIERAKIGSFSAAFRAFAKSAVFPGIVSQLCPRPCESACPRADVDDPVALNRIERFLWQDSQATPPKPFYIPDKKKRILIVGGGLSGMTAAAKLAQRGYRTTLAEKGDRLGGQLLPLLGDRLSPSVFEAEIAALHALKYLHIETKCEMADLPCEGFDAILVCTGAGGATFGNRADGNRADGDRADGNRADGDRAEPQTGVFFAGAVRNPALELLSCIREASDRSYEIETYIKVGRMPGESSAESTASQAVYRPDTARVPRKPSALPPADNPLDADQAQGEAQRCLLCACNRCVESCDLLQYHRKDPKKAIVELSDTLHSTPLSGKPALRAILSCTQCGRCRDVCPVGIDFQAVYMESKQLLAQKKQVPSAIYAYWLDEMKDAQSEDAYLAIAASEGKRARYVLFPGCQMGASDPAYVAKTFTWMRERFGGSSALLVSCCGAPAEWAAEGESHAAVLARIRDAWVEWDRPTFVLPCPTCIDVFARHLPDIQILSLWELKAQEGEAFPQNTRERATLFDPCASSDFPSMRQSVRRLLDRCGLAWSETPEEDKGRCCGYGGLIYGADRTLYETVLRSAYRPNAGAVITYCTNCRDHFAADGQPALHVLDAIFFPDEDRAARTPPTLTARRHNRHRLKRELAHAFLAQEPVPPPEDLFSFALSIDEAVQRKMDRDLVVEDNVKAVIAYAEQSGKKVLDKESGRITAHLAQGKLTFWVCYEAEGEGSFRLHNVYLHRMSIEETP